MTGFTHRKSADRRRTSMTEQTADPNPRRAMVGHAVSGAENPVAREITSAARVMLVERKWKRMATQTIPVDDSRTAGSIPTAVPAAVPSAATELADPTPLAFAAVGLPFGVISLSLTGHFTPDLTVITVPLALIYGTIGLLISGLVAFRKGDIFGAFVYTSFSAFFLSFGMITVLLALKITAFTAAGQGATFATFLLGWAVIITYLMLLSFKYPRLFNVIFILVWACLIILAYGFAQSTSVLHAGAWLGVVIGALCLYGSAAVLTNTMVERPMLKI